MSFNLDQFISDCRKAAATNRLQSVVEAVWAAVSDPCAVIEVLPPKGEEEILLHHDADLTIYRVLVFNGLQYPPHEHGMSVVIGQYSGCETNLLFKRTGKNSATQIERSGRMDVKAPGVRALGGEVIHAVTNFHQEPSAALHVYMGDLPKQKRSLWTLDLDGERQFDEEHYFGWAKTQLPDPAIVLHPQPVYF